MGTGSNSKTTLEDLARLAGVSVSTVSRALNDQPLISTRTKQRIWALARDNDYPFRASMPSAPIGAEGSIAIVTPFTRGRPLPLSHPFFLELLASIGEAARARDCDFTVSHVAAANYDDLVHATRTSRASGVIFLGQAALHDEFNRLIDLNARLVVWGAHLPGQRYPSVDSSWWDCIAGGQTSPGMGSDYEQAITPTLITSRWLTAIVAIGYYCGGAHPDGDTTSLTFDLATGAEVDLNGWLNAAAIEPRLDIGKSAFALKPALRRLAIAQGEGIEADCRNPVATADFWDIGLTGAGLAFTPGMPHVLAACANPMTVPWKALAPCLSQAGRAGRQG